MIEVLIAIFVVSMGVLGTISSLWYGIKSERHSERRTQAIYQARELLNLIRARNEPFNNNHLDLGSNLNDGNYDDDSDDVITGMLEDAPGVFLDRTRVKPSSTPILLALNCAFR